MGEVGFVIIKKRRKIALENIKKAFPELSAKQQKRLALNHFRSLGMGLIEALCSWNADFNKLREIAKVEGMENVPQNKGAIIMFFHFTSLEIGCSLLGLATRVAAVYRKQNNTRFNAVMEQGRNRFEDKTGSIIIDKNDLRFVLKYLKNGGKVVIASDQNSTAGNWTFVDFFGQKVPVTTAVSKLAKATESKVLPLSVRKGKTSYKLKIHPAFTNFGQDPKQDAQTMMNWLETEARQIPEQYLWTHRIFKSPHKNSYTRLLK